jgi:hypothetical protein
LQLGTSQPSKFEVTLVYGSHLEQEPSFSIYSSKSQFGIKQKQSNPRECVVPECKDREKIMPDGSCQKCEENTILSGDKKKCLIPNCDFDEYIENDGSCSRCEPYTRVTSNLLGCEVPSCNPNEVITDKGTC